MPTKFSKILVGVDDSADALAAFDYALHQAVEDQAELVIASILEDENLNVYEAMNKDYVHGERDELETHLEEYTDKAHAAGIATVHAVIGEGNPGEVIVKDVISAYDPDLLVIGSEAKKGIARHFGSQAAYMAKHSPISVMVIREPENKN